MKKLFAILIAVMMMASALTVAVGAEEDAICVTGNLDAVEAMVGSLVANDTGTVNISGKSLLIKTLKDEKYNLNGDPTSKNYNPNYNGSRRLKLKSFDDGKVLPAGTYTISLYVYESGNHLGAQLSHKSEIAVSLHTAEETDDTLAYNHATAETLVKLFPADSEDTANSFEKSGVVQKVGTRNWGQYTAEITVSEPVSQFTFWIIADGESCESSTISTYIDNLAIYNEAGDPTPKEEESSDTTDSQETPDPEDNTTTAPVTTAAPQTTEAPATTNSDEEEKGGCGAVAGIGTVCALALCAVGMLRKKKED